MDEILQEAMFHATITGTCYVMLTPHSPAGVAILCLESWQGETLAIAFSRVSPDARDPREATVLEKLRSLQVGVLMGVAANTGTQQ